MHYNPYVPPAYMEPVDLGLPSGNLWAKGNLGAQNEWDDGYYFSWGETEPRPDDWATTMPYDWAHDRFNGGNSDYNEGYFNEHLSEWCNISGDTIELKPEYDGVKAMLGGAWEMPTADDIRELISGTTSKWVLNYYGSGVQGPAFISKANGNTLFFPATGNRNGSSVEGHSNSLGVWSRTLYAVTRSHAYGLFADKRSSVCLYNSNRYVGFSLRPISKSL